MMAPSKMALSKKDMTLLFQDHYVEPKCPWTCCLY